MNVAFLMLEINNLSGGGGSERFTVDFIDLYNRIRTERFLYFFTDDPTRLKEVGRLHDAHFLRIIPFPFRRFKRLMGSRYRIYADWVNWWFGTLWIVGFCKINNVSILHIPLYTDRYYQLLKWVFALARYVVPDLRLVLSLVDSRMPYHYFSNQSQDSYISHNNYGRLFSSIPIDAILTYYVAVKHLLQDNHILSSRPIIKNVTTRFTMTSFASETIRKEQIIVWAGRMDVYKCPMFFLESLADLFSLGGYSDWQFKIYGMGPLRESVQEFIAHKGWAEKVILGATSDLRSVFEKSLCFVSTQDYENFTSNSMAEAMAKANAIVSRNVGQTNLYVHNNVNGVLLDEDTPQALAKVLATIMGDPNRVIEMGKQSIKILQDFHRPEDFIQEIDSLWSMAEKAPRAKLVF